MKSELHDAMCCSFFSCISKQPLSRIIPVCFLPSYLCDFSKEPKGGLLGFKSFTGQSALISSPAYFSFLTVTTKFKGLSVGLTLKEPTQKEYSCCRLPSSSILYEERT